MTLEAQIREAAEVNEAYSIPQMVALLRDMPWTKHFGRYFLEGKSVDTVLREMRSHWENASLFRNHVIAPPRITPINW